MYNASFKDYFKNEVSILLVEDNKLVADVAVYVLEQRGYKVLACYDMQCAIEAIDNLEHLDLLFTDFLLPDEHVGTEIAEVARKKLPELPVLFTSGYAGPAISQAWLQQEQVSFLQKPYKPAQLLVAVEQLLNGRKN